MKAIFGLGNPGNEFKKTRHNIGFMVLDAFAEAGASWKSSKKTLAKIIKTENFVLVKPQTFMNASGKSAAMIAKYYNMNTEDIIVVHDDSDLTLGTIRIQFNKSAGGHNGVQSIIDHLGSKRFYRIRVGIRPSKSKQKAMQFVLKPCKKNEQPLLKEAINTTTEALEYILMHGPQKAMNIFNQK